MPYLAGHLKMFLQANGLMMKKSDKREATHFSLNGWKVQLQSEEQEVEFLKLYAQDLENNVPLFLIERKTENFAMHIDFDWVQKDVVTVDFMKIIIKHFKEAFQKFYPEHSGKVFHSLLMNSSPVEKTGSDGITKCMKTGFHVVWPHLVVNKDRALKLRSYAVEMLRHHMGSRKAPQNSFDDAVDECVLRENGFRMMGSYKAKKCKCRSREQCLECEGSRWIAVDRKYEVEVMLDGDGNELPTQTNFLRANMVHAVRLSSIRRNDSVEMTDGYVLPIDAVSVHLDDKPFRRRLKQRKDGTERNLQFQKPCFHDDKKGYNTKKFCNELPIDTLLVSELQDLIRRYDPIYNRINIKKVRCNKKKTEYRVDTTGFGAHYCMNVKRNHNSNHIYFTINVDGIYQGCYSRTENHACSVQCKDFSGRKMELTESVRFALFDNDTLEAKRKKLERKLKTTEPRHKRRKTKMEM